MDTSTNHDPPAGPSPQRLRILVVDDEPSVRSVLQDQLQADGHEVHTAPDGNAGLERFVGERWDVVLTDRVMPGLSGDELAEAIKRINAEMPIILVTAYAERCPEGGRSDVFDFIIRKPFTRETIRAALRIACKK